jgi:predicted CoA-substrate-specific enzyme activase
MVFAGIDVGSLATKAVIFDGERILSYAVRRTGADPLTASISCLREAISLCGLKEDQLDNIVATGYGRIRVPFAEKEVTEITCHGRGAFFLFPMTRTVIDIGGQDAKIIILDGNGKVVDFAMNDKCAAGTGKFLEVMSQTLELSIDEFAGMGLKSKKALSINSMCTVFAESEIISLIAEGARREDIIWGLHLSIARRIVGMAKRLSLKEEITFTGGVAKNKAMVRALNTLLATHLNVPEEPQITGALGAAIIASLQAPFKA